MQRVPLKEGRTRDHVIYTARTKDVEVGARMGSGLACSFPNQAGIGGVPKVQEEWRSSSFPAGRIRKL
jgi:hypothetical protein